MIDVNTRDASWHGWMDVCDCRSADGDDAGAGTNEGDATRARVWTRCAGWNAPMVKDMTIVRRVLRAMDRDDC